MLPDAAVADYRVADINARLDPHSWFQELGQPLVAMTRSVDRGAAAGNGPAAIQRFDPIHHPGHIFGFNQALAILREVGTETPLCCGGETFSVNPLSQPVSLVQILIS